MNKMAIILALLVALTLPALAQKQEFGQIVVEGFRTLDITGNSMTFTGTANSQVHVFSKDGRLDAKTSKVVVTKAAQGGVQTAKLTGGVWVHVVPQPGRVTTATADSAVIDYGANQLAVLSGNVKITSTDPQLFVGPATVTGDKATINLRQNIGPDEARIHIESAPEKSRLEFTPKQPPTKPEPQTTEQKK